MYYSYEYYTNTSTAVPYRICCNSLYIAPAPSGPRQQVRAKRIDQASTELVLVRRTDELVLDVPGTRTVLYGRIIAERYSTGTGYSTSIHQPFAYSTRTRTILNWRAAAAGLPRGKNTRTSTSTSTARGRYRTGTGTRAVADEQAAQKWRMRLKSMMAAQALLPAEQSSSRRGRLPTACAADDQGG